MLSEAVRKLFDFRAVPWQPQNVLHCSVSEKTPLMAKRRPYGKLWSCNGGGGGGETAARLFLPENKNAL